MINSSGSERSFHNLDGVPDERRRRRQRVQGLFLTNPVAGEIIDLSADGVAVECNRPLSIHQCYPLTLVTRSSSKIHKHGQVRWCRLTSTGVASTGEPTPIYRVGVAFIGS